jgi:hypothetical protein
MPPSKRAVQAWASLNERQRIYMRIIFSADQDAERLAKGAWSRGEDSRPASEWRWLEYGPVGSPLGAMGKLQVRLQSAGVRDPGAGATLAALAERGLVERTHRPGFLADVVWVKLTTAGRAACRAGGLDPHRALQPKRGQLSEALWGMLADVHAAEPDGYGAKWADGAWDRLTHREPEPFVTVTANPDSPAPGRRFWPYVLHLTDAGRRHIEEHWEAYARLYPGVDAPRPDGSGVWPYEVDQALKRLRETAYALLARVRETLAEAERIGGTAAAQVEASKIRELTQLVTARNKAAAAYDAAVARAAGRYRAVLDEQAADLTQLYRRAAVRYVLAAVAVVDAVVAGKDPGEAVQQEASAVDVAEWPWIPEPPPSTGLPEVDASLSEAHRAAAGLPAPGKPKTSRRTRRSHVISQAEPPLEPEADRLMWYGTKLAELVAGGQLVRLLLRARATR